MSTRVYSQLKELQRYGRRAAKPLRQRGHRLFVVVAAVALVAPIALNQSLALEWDEPRNVHPQTAVDDLFPKIVNGPDGAPWVIWLGTDPVELDRDIYYARWNGAEWSPPSLVNPPNLDFELPPQVSTSRDGGLWVLWTAPNPSSPGAYLGLTSSWTGAGWALPDTVWRDGARHNGWSIASVSRTEAWFVRDGASSAGSSDIFAYHRRDGFWDPVFQFVQPDSDEVVPTVAIDGDGIPWAAWIQQSTSDPPSSPMQYSRYVGGTWVPPAQISAPRGTGAPKLTSDSTGTPWIVTLASAPFWPTAAEAWAVRWSGSTWDVPVRLSAPVLPEFTILYQLSVSDEPGSNPVAVWVSRYAFSTTRADLNVSLWTGTSWTPTEIVGSLADSALVTWPDVALSDGAVWAAYNRGVGHRTFVQNVFSIRSAKQSDPTAGIKFSAAPNTSGVLLVWSENLQRDVLSFRILRGREGVDPLRLVELPGYRSRAGSYLDRTVPSAGVYSYWIEFSMAQGETLAVGPRSVEFVPSRRAARIEWAVADAPAGTVTIGGIPDGRPTQRVLIFDVHGRRVRALEVRSARLDRFEVTWDGRTELGEPAPAGVYFAQLYGQEGGHTYGKKLVLLK